MHFFQETAAVLSSRQLARETHCVRLHTPAIAAAIRPGQFVMLRLPGTSDPLLGRPFALYDTVLDDAGRPVGIDIVYLVVGKLTGLLTQLQPGDQLHVWGPLGNGFTHIVRESCKHVYLVAGGIGQTPFLACIRDLLGDRGYGAAPPDRKAEQVSLFYGVRTKDLAAGIADFQNAGAAVHLASDDGSAGYRGFVTSLVESHPRPDHIIGCGPEPMMHALAELARRWNVPCHLSLESPMACGVGICFSCVTRVQTDDGWDYRRVCVDGPVFDAAKLAW